MTRKNSRIERCSIPLFTSLVVMTAAIVALVYASPLAAASQVNTRTSVQQSESQGTPSGGPEALHLIVDRSLVVTSPAQITRVSLANPDICDAVVVSPTEILLNGKRAGATSLVIWGQSGQMQTFDVYVDLDVLDLTRDIRSTFPNVPVKVSVSKNIVTLSGHVSSAAVADKILELAQSMVPNKKDVVSLLAVPAPPTGEVMLKVRFAEVDRSALTQLGVNIMSLPPAKNIGYHFNRTVFTTRPCTARRRPGWLYSRQPAERVHFPSGHQPGQHHPGAPDQEPSADSGRTQRLDGVRQRGQFPLRRRVSVSDAPVNGCRRRRSCHHHSVSAIWNKA